MKKIPFILFLLFVSVARAQDDAFFENLNVIRTKADARAVADSLAAHLRGDFVFYKMKEFDNGVLRVVYVPQGMTEGEIKAQNDYENSFVADFKAVTSENRGYMFNMAKARYNVLFPAWQHWFSKEAQPDKKIQRYTNAEKGFQYTFINRGEVWAIGR